MEWDGEEPVFVGISKIDLSAEENCTAVVKSLSYGKEVVGGEAFFVPSQANQTGTEGQLQKSLNPIDAVEQALVWSAFTSVVLKCSTMVPWCEIFCLYDTAGHGQLMCSAVPGKRGA